MDVVCSIPASLYTLHTGANVVVFMCLHFRDSFQKIVLCSCWVCNVWVESVCEKCAFAFFCFPAGKTLAYAIPVVQDLQSISPNISRDDGPYAIVVTPTREVGPLYTMYVRVCV